MPVFFHLKLELFKSPASAFRSKHTHQSSNSTFVPSSNTDIFTVSLPAHESHSLPQARQTRSIDRQIAKSPSLNTKDSSPSHGSAVLLPLRNSQLHHRHSSLPLNAPARTTNEDCAEDWRYDLVSIESIDMEPQAGSVGRMGKTPATGLHTRAVYLASESKTTVVGWGVVHLYRDTDDVGEEQQYQRRVKGNAAEDDEAFNPKDCSTLCILAVPSWMMPSDLLGFVGDQAREDVSHFRLIRTGRANKYMALMKFRSPKKATEWQLKNNGRLFSAAEPENCHVVFIRSVEFMTSTSDTPEGSKATFPDHTHDPFVAAKNPTALSSKPIAPPARDLDELPTCPVCLERMDETTGLLTILCQHVFHCACLEKWRGSGCPVCRYTHSPSYTFPYPRPYSNGSAEQDTDPMCSVCTTTNNVWICLICGNLGCGRYDAAHAYAHYESTSHCYAMDISSQRVWDYAGDGYVHRLIQSKPDARPIEMPTAHARHENEAFRAEGGDSVPREKMENMAAEYTYLLTSQLEGQRRYFEELMERAADKTSQATARAEGSAQQAASSAASLDQLLLQARELTASVTRLEKMLERSEKVKDKFEQMARELSSSLREEKLMNDGLLKRVKAADEHVVQAQAEAKQAVAEKRELEEMNHDLTMFISSQEKVKELQAQGEEVVDGSIGVVQGTGRKKKGRQKG